MNFIPHAYQQHCIDRIINQPDVGLYIDMGLGKTIISLSAVKELKYHRFQVFKVLVIAPKKVAEATWSLEKDKWEHTRCLKISQILGNQKQRIRAIHTPADVYIINRENVTWLVDYHKNDWPYDMVIIDESSSFKSHKAKRFRALAAIRPHIRRMVELTGTPSPNGVEDLWAQVYLLDQGARLGTRFGGFRERYFIPGPRSQAGIVYSYKPKPQTYDTVMDKISDICISMKAEDYLQLPDMVMHEVPVVLDHKAEKAYRDLEKKMVMEIPETEEEISVSSAAALTNKLLQLGNGAVYDDDRTVHHVHDCKLDAFMELVESLQGKPALVFYNYQHDLSRLQEALKKTDLRVRLLKKPEDQAAWNGGEVDILLAHPASSAYGLNLQQGGNHVIWFGLTWNYELYTQANKRLHRQGQTEKVIIHHLVSQGTRDIDVMRALERKEDVQEYVLQSLKARIAEIRRGV
jgi:SNF2 family DNA or RNA helicase